ncbi:MAG: nitroreductase family protein [Clostridia bacterium]|nr:nitroreductase family protein [Clostridia bacterium]
MSDLLTTRRSIRRFTDECIPAETITALVSTAAYAPSWKNTQTTRYIAVTDKALISRIADECTLGFEHNRGIIAGAPVLMVLTTMEGRSGYERDGSFTTAKGTHWQSFDAGIAAQTFCLAAHARGLGTVMLGIFDEAKVAELLCVPQGQSVSVLIPLGHPAEAPNAPKRKSAEELLTVL